MDKKNVPLKIFKNSLRLGAIFTTLLLSNQKALSQEDSIKVHEIDEVIVTAFRMEQNLNEVGRSVTVINQEEIKNSIYTSVSELLSQQEGIYIVGTGQNPGSLQRMFLRGANSDHTAILIDGVRITDPSSTDNAINLAELSLTNIERIEIVRGSHGTLYGSSTIGGIINIITKRKEDNGINGDVGVKAGTFGSSTLELTENVYLNYSHESGLYFSGEITNTKVSGMDATVDTITVNDTYNQRDQDDFDKLDVIGKMGYKDENWDAFASYKLTSQNLDIDDKAYADDDNYTVDFTRNLISYQAAYRFNDKFNLKILGGYTDMQRIALDDSSVVDAAGSFDHAFSRSDFSGTVLNNELQAAYKSDKISFIIGGGSYGETMTSKSFYINTAWGYTSQSDLDSLNINSNITSVFAHADFGGELLFEKANRLNLAIGVRYNNHNAFGGNTTFEVNPSYKVGNNALLYASYSTGFNAPALYRLYSPNENFVSGVKRGNTELSPETSISFELGIKQEITPSTTLSISVFQTEVDNLIEYVYLWDKTVGIDTLGNDWMRDDHRGDTYLNIGLQVNKGFEISVHSKLSEKLILNGNLSLVSGSLTYVPESTSFTNDYHVQLYATGDFLTQTITSSSLVRRSNTGNIALTYKANTKLQLSGNIRHASTRSDVFYDGSLGPWGALGRRSVGDYTLVGLSVNYKIIEKLNTTFKIDNVANVDYQEIYGFSTRGRGYYLRLSYSF